MLRATFQLLAGLGPRRERALWQAGVVDWSLTEPAVTSAVLPKPLANGLADRAAAAAQALAAGDLAQLGRLLPEAEHWRLFPAFADRAVFLDIEADSTDGITAIGLVDRDGAHLLLGDGCGRWSDRGSWNERGCGPLRYFGPHAADRDPPALPDLLPESALLVTYNGACFDLPHLRRAFPDWRPPTAHIDLRPVWQRLGQHGGLKALEQSQGFGRPAHLRGLDGDAACWLWRHGQLGNHQAMQRFAEYNLYDVINLPPLLGLAYNRLADKAGLGAPPVPVCYRGDVLYDVSKILLSLVQQG